MSPAGFSSERELQLAVIQLARYCNWLYMHITDSRKSAAVGFPDLVLAHRETGRVLFVELKSDTGKPTDQQREWLHVLGKQCETHLWRPADWRAGLVQDVLTGERQAVA